MPTIHEKRALVLAALRHDPARSDRLIAAELGCVSPSYVRKLRGQLEREGQLTRDGRRRGRDRKMRVTPGPVPHDVFGSAPAPTEMSDEEYARRMTVLDFLRMLRSLHRTGPELFKQMVLARYERKKCDTPYDGPEERAGKLAALTRLASGRGRAARLQIARLVRYILDHPDDRMHYEHPHWPKLPAWAPPPPS